MIPDVELGGNISGPTQLSGLAVPLKVHGYSPRPTFAASTATFIEERAPFHPFGHWDLMFMAGTQLGDEETVQYVECGEGPEPR